MAKEDILINIGVIKLIANINKPGRLLVISSAAITAITSIMLCSILVSFIIAANLPAK
jgi:hypothetical protein